MKIVIAAWHLTDFNVGIGRYCRELIEALGRVDRENAYEVLMPESSYRFPARENFRYRVIRFPLFRRRFWEQVAPLLVRKYDLLHFPYDAGIIWKKGKFVVTVHDVKPLIFPELKSRRNVNSWVQGILVGDKWAKIDHVLTVSNCSRHDIAERVGFPEDRVTVVYPGVALEQFRPGAPSTSSREGRPNRRPYVLCVSGGDPTKNVDTLIEAFAGLPRGLRDGYDLVLAGDLRRRGDLRERVAEAGLEKQTIFAGCVSDERLIELYQSATLFVFPSRYEGFGLPVLEAMACGCPVICSDASSLPEVAGHAAILIPPSDVQGFTAAMTRVLTDSTLEQSLRERGLEQAARFSWDRTARETVEVYRRVEGLEG